MLIVAVVDDSLLAEFAIGVIDRSFQTCDHSVEVFRFGHERGD